MHQGQFSKITHSLFWTKLTHWEYWPFEIVYFPIYFYWIWLSIKSRSFFFFSAANPGIEYGGMLGESKFRIHKSLPADQIPVTLFVKKDASYDHVRSLISDSGLKFPVILKPDIGERGWMVSKVCNDEDLKNYLATIGVDFLIQEYIDLPVEFGVFYYRYPGQKTGKVSSIVQKKMLEITGNGTDSVEDLMMSDPRARLQIPSFRKDNPELLTMVPEKAAVLELMPIGNHSRGTTFLNGNHLINNTLDRVFDDLSKKIEGFYFGRFDIRCASEKDLYQGKFKIMELNGAGAEPGHIYHPGSSLLEAYSSILSHLNALYQISRENRRRGILYMSFRDGLQFIKKIRKYNRQKTIPKGNSL